MEPVHRQLTRWEVVVVSSPEDGPVALELVNVSRAGFAVRGTAQAGQRISGEIAGQPIRGRVADASDSVIRVELTEASAAARDALVAMAGARAA